MSLSIWNITIAPITAQLLEIEFLNEEKKNMSSDG